MSIVYLALLVVVAITVALLFVRFRPGGSHGTAGFGSWPGTKARALADLPPGMVFGKTAAGEYAGWQGEGHWLVVAPTGAGKSTGVLMPTVANWRGPLVAVDIKGELARTCAPALQAAGIKCYRLDPFDVLADMAGSVQQVNFDPVRRLGKLRQPDEGCRRLAELLIDAGGERDAHWAGTAREVVAGLVEARLRRGETLGMLPGFMLDKKSLLSGLYNGGDFNGRLVAQAAAIINTAGPNERGAVMSTVRRQLSFLGSEEVARTLRDAADLSHLVQGKPVAFFVVLPPEMLGPQARLLRLVVGCVAQELLEAGPSRERRLLIAIDEAAALGHMDEVLRGVGLHRGYGARYLLSFQDLSQLHSVYGQDGADTLQANCNALFWGCRDLTTCNRVADLLGDTTTLARMRNHGAAPLGPDGTSLSREVARPLLTPDEVRRLPDTQVLAMVAGQRPVLLERIMPGDGLGASGQMVTPETPVTSGPAAVRA